jgi:hypothetical protein
VPQGATLLNRKALVTIALGDAYQATWRKHCQPTWQAYAFRHGYDVIVITDYIDRGALSRQRSPHWQKLLILHHSAVKEYDHVVWLDADIAINAKDAPCVVEGMSEKNRIGVVIEKKGEEKDPLRDAVNRRQAASGQTLNQGGLTWADVYKNLCNRLARPETLLPNKGFNAGVMVLQPHCHAGLLETVYRKYPEYPGSWFENVPLSYHLVSNHLEEGIPESFNVNVASLLYAYYPFLLNRDHFSDELATEVARVILENSYFLHFLGGGISRQLLTYL